jgi:hypothetical protein
MKKLACIVLFAGLAACASTAGNEPGNAAFQVHGSAISSATAGR